MACFTLSGIPNPCCSAPETSFTLNPTVFVLLTCLLTSWGSHGNQILSAVHQAWERDPGAIWYPHQIHGLKCSHSRLNEDLHNYTIPFFRSYFESWFRSRSKASGFSVYIFWYFSKTSFILFFVVDIAQPKCFSTIGVVILLTELYIT